MNAILGLDLGHAARQAARGLSVSSGRQRDAALRAMAAALADVRAQLAAANTADLADARAAGIGEPLAKRPIVGDMQRRLHQAAVLRESSLDRSLRPLPGGGSVRSRPHGARAKSARTRAARRTTVGRASKHRDRTLGRSKRVRDAPDEGANPPARALPDLWGPGPRQTRESGDYQRVTIYFLALA